jgi:hypothetical protein
MGGRARDGLDEPVAGGRLALRPRPLDLYDAEWDLLVEGSGQHVDLRGGAHLLEQEGLIPGVQRAVATDAGHGLAVDVEAQEEQRDAVPLVEVLEVQLSLEAEVAVAPLRLVQVELPQVGSLIGVVPLEPHP